MSTRKTTLVYAVLIAFAAGMIIASRFDMTPMSSAQTFALPPMNSAPITGSVDAQTFRNIAKAQSPMVVNISTEMKGGGQDLSDFFGGGGGTPDDLFRRFFGQPGDPRQGQPPQQQPRRQRREPTVRAAGTGFIISKDGLILTNNHVVEDALEIKVQMFGEESDISYDAKLVGRDPLSDSALIQLTEKPNHPLPVAQFGDSTQMAAGDWVMAIGNPFNQGWTVTVGVISAMQRPFDANDLGRPNEMIQTDAAINPGNSGGPLLNLRGEVIGMNTAIISNGRTEGNIGIGYAVPINTIRELLPQLSTGKVVRGKIGVQIELVPRENYQEDFGLKTRSGVLVKSVIPAGPAEKAGLLAGDVILEFNGKPVANTAELQKMVAMTKPGTSAPVKIVREKKERTLNITIEELDLDAERQEQRSGQRRPPEPQQDDSGQESFGISLGNVTPQMARRLQLPAGRTGALVVDVDPNGPAAASLTENDVILSVNDQPTPNVAAANRELEKVPAGRNARIVVWRNDRQVFVTVKKD